MTVAPSFEIPQQLRELTEKNLEQARVGYGQFIDAMTQAMGMWVGAAPTNPMTSGFRVVQDCATKFAKQNADLLQPGERTGQCQGPYRCNGDSSPPCADRDANVRAASAGTGSSHVGGLTEHVKGIGSPAKR
jgi:hypothetical protein